MALWSSTDANTGAPKFAAASGLGVSANGRVLYANTQARAFVTDATVGVFGVDTNEMANTSATNKANDPAHSGWILRKTGMGKIDSITAGVANRSNVGNAYITFSGGGTVNTSANAQIFVNSVSNVVTSITLNSVGLYETTPTATVSGNANVTITLVMGGRANRVQTEVLVAMGSMTGDGSASANDDVIFQDTAG